MKTAVCGVLLIGSSCASPLLLISQNASNVQAGEASSVGYGDCPAPARAGVNVCWGSYGQVESPFQVIASGTGGLGPVKLMELWADGRKIAQSAGNLFDAPVILPSGPHQLTVVELDTTAHYLKSTPFSTTVAGSSEGETCSALGVRVLANTWKLRCERSCHDHFNRNRSKRKSQPDGVVD